jgi:hypothetical protein
MEREILAKKIIDLEQRMTERQEKIGATKAKLHFRARDREGTADLEQYLADLEAIQDVDRAEHADLIQQWEELPPA